MLDTFVEAVKFVGGLGGIASSIFLIYDRIYRFRPSAYLIPKDYKANIRVDNVADETVILDEITITPGLLEIVRANDLVTANEERQVSWYGSTARKLPEGAYVVLKPSQSRTFALHRSADFENAKPEVRVTIRCRWRNTRHSFPWSRYVRIKTTVKDIRDIIESSMTNKVI